GRSSRSTASFCAVNTYIWRDIQSAIAGLLFRCRILWLGRGWCACLPFFRTSHGRLLAGTLGIFLRQSVSRQRQNNPSAKKAPRKVSRHAHLMKTQANSNARCSLGRVGHCRHRDRVLVLARRNAAVIRSASLNLVDFLMGEPDDRSPLL